MISEDKLAELSHSGAPKIVTEIPGPKAKKIVSEAPLYESMARGGGQAPVVFDEARGVTFKDPDGNLFIDMSAGVGVNSVGRCHPEVIEAIQHQSQGLMHASDIGNTKRDELARKISSIAPPGLRDNCVTYFTQSGSGAVETAIKFARKITGRHQILAFHGAYHGVWGNANTLTTGEAYRQGFGPLMGGVIHAPYPYAYRFPFDTGEKSVEEAAGDYVDYLLNTPYTAADDVAAVIVEPVQGEGGYIPPAPEFLQKVKAACEKHGALLIVDEVQSGAGRTGKMWAVEHSGVEPDMSTFGKGMGGDMPLAGLMMRRDLAEHIVPSSQPNTWAVNGVSAAVCMTNIDIITKYGLIDRAAELGEELMQKLREASNELSIIGEVRGRGLMIGVELVADRSTREPLSAEAMGAIMGSITSKGVVMVPCGKFGNVMRLMPSLTISRDYANKAVDLLIDTLREVQ